jgi:hypothetical protein
MLLLCWLLVAGYWLLATGYWLGSVVVVGFSEQ